MKKMAVLRITLLFLLVRGLYAQTPIQDVSEKGGPLVLGPSVTADEYYDWNVTAQNVSEKEILAYAVNFDELVTRRDLYFGKDHPSFSSKSTQVIMELPGAPKPSTIRAVVTWVQFADGLSGVTQKRVRNCFAIGQHHFCSTRKLWMSTTRTEMQRSLPY